MRILVLYAQPVFWSMGEGCGATSFTRFLSALAERGHEVDVSLPAGSAPGTNGRTPPPVTESYFGCRLYRFPDARGYVPNPRQPVLSRLADRVDCWMSYQRDAARLALALALARPVPPDVVIGMGYYEAPAARRVAARLRRPNVTRLFGTTLSLHLDSPLRFYANFPEVIALRTPADLVISSDDGAEAARVVRRLRQPAGRFIHLRNGLDFERFRPGPPSAELRARLGVPEDHRIILTGTRLAAEKRLDRAVDLLAALAHMGVPATLVFTGDGPERGRLQAQVHRLGLEDRVRFPGPIPQHEMVDWYRTADLVLSLLDRTNASNPVFEAMACGRPVAALDVGTTRELVQPGETGILVAPGEFNRLAAETARLLREDTARRRLGEEGARRIRRLLPDVHRKWHYEAELIEAVASGRPPATAATAPIPPAAAGASG